LCLSILFIATSCSNNENESIVDSKEVPIILAQRTTPLVGEIVVDSLKYVLNEDGSVTRFVDNKVDFTLFTVYEPNLTCKQISNGYEFRTENGEILTIEIGTEVERGKFITKMSIVDSDGILYELDDMIVDEQLLDNEVMMNPAVVKVVVRAVVGALADAVFGGGDGNDNFVTACRKSVVAASKAGAAANGKPTLTITTGFWGNSCEFACL
jgi:hypothetical protein